MNLADWTGNIDAPRPLKCKGGKAEAPGRGGKKEGEGEREEGRGKGEVGETGGREGGKNTVRSQVRPTDRSTGKAEHRRLFHNCCGYLILET